MQQSRNEHPSPRQQDAHGVLRRREERLEKVRAIARDNPSRMANILKNWLSDTTK